MKEIITNKDIQKFLKDWEVNSTVELLLEEGKEFNELVEIANTRGIQLKGNNDLAGVRFIYAFADIPNKNGAILPTKELLRALPSMIGKPLDLEHQRGYVIGHFLDYKWIVKEKKVIAYAVVYKSNFAQEWADMEKLFKEGKLFTSFELWSDHSKRKTLPDGSYELYDISVAGGAILLKESPAFPGAKVLELAKDRMINSNLVFASTLKDEDIIIAENDSKAAEIKTDNAAIQTVVEGEKKVETKKEEVVVAAEVAAIESPKTVEKIAEATVPPVEEKKIEEVKVEAKEEAVVPIIEEKTVEPVKEEAKTVIQEQKTTIIADPVKDAAAGTVDMVTTTIAVTKVTDTYKTEQPLAVQAAEVVPAVAKSAEVVAPVECAKCKELELQVTFYKENAVEIAKRRTELGDYAKDISDVDILDTTKFSDAKVIKANAEIATAATIVGTKTTDVDAYKKYQDEVRDKADGKIRRSH